MARKPKKGQPKGIGRPPVAKKSEATKEFVVSPGFSIGGFDGVRKDGGDTIVLTEKQAKHMVKLKAIVIELGDFSTDAEVPVTKSKPAKDKAEGSSGNKAEGDGDAAAGASSGSPTL